MQKPAPDFKGTAVVNNDFKDIQLSDYKGKYLVLFFYPLDLYVITITTDKLIDFFSSDLIIILFPIVI